MSLRGDYHHHIIDNLIFLNDLVSDRQFRLISFNFYERSRLIFLLML